MEGTFPDWGPATLNITNLWLVSGFSLIHGPSPGTFGGSMADGDRAVSSGQ